MTAMSMIRMRISPMSVKVVSAIIMVNMFPDIPVRAPKVPGTPA